VLSVFEKILRESQTRNVKLRPLMVQLLGPSLLPDPEEKELAPPGEGAANGENKLTGFENVLVQITLALHRAVVRELTQAYRERMTSLAFPIWRGRKQLDTHRTNAFLEAPGQLALELDEYPARPVCVNSGDVPARSPMACCRGHSRARQDPQAMSCLLTRVFASWWRFVQ
jgi:hypothetical protein